MEGRRPRPRMRAEKRAAQRRGYTNRLTSRPFPATEARRPPVWNPACPKSLSSRRQEIIWKSGKQEGNGPCLLSFPDVPDFLIQPIWSSFDFDSDFLSQLKIQNSKLLTFLLRNPMNIGSSLLDIGYSIALSRFRYEGQTNAEMRQTNGRRLPSYCGCEHFNPLLLCCKFSQFRPPVTKRSEKSVPQVFGA